MFQAQRPRLRNEHARTAHAPTFLRSPTDLGVASNIAQAVVTCRCEKFTVFCMEDGHPSINKGVLMPPRTAPRGRIPLVSGRLHWRVGWGAIGIFQRTRTA